MMGVFKKGPFRLGADEPDGTWVAIPLAGETLDEVGAGVILMAVLLIGDGVWVAAVNDMLALGLGVDEVLGRADDPFRGTTGENFIVTLTAVILSDFEMLVRVSDRLRISVLFRLRTGTSDTLLRDPFTSSSGLLLGAVVFDTKETVMFWTTGLELGAVVELTTGAVVRGDAGATELALGALLGVVVAFSTGDELGIVVAFNTGDELGIVVAFNAGDELGAVVAFRTWEELGAVVLTIGAELGAVVWPETGATELALGALLGVELEVGSGVLPFRLGAEVGFVVEKAGAADEPLLGGSADAGAIVEVLVGVCDGIVVEAAGTGIIPGWVVNGAVVGIWHRYWTASTETLLRSQICL
jgi:hypothetical protein